MASTEEVRRAVERLGGIEAVAATLDLTTRAVEYWIRVGHFPLIRRIELTAMARRHRFRLDHLFVESKKQGRPRRAETQEAIAE